MFELSGGHGLMRWSCVAPGSVLARTWLIFGGSEAGGAVDLPGFARTGRFNESA